MKIKRMISLFLVILLCMSLAACGQKEESGNAKIYYINSLGDGIGSVSYTIKSKKNADQIEELLKKLSEDPDSVEYRKTITDKTNVVDYSLDSGTLSLYFDQEYSEIEGYAEVLVRAAIVKTLVQIDEVDAVAFYVGENPLQDESGAVVGSMSDDTFVSDYDAESESLEETTLTLYFASADGQSLVKKEQTVYYSKNVSKERLIMDYLLRGPQEDDAKDVIPSGTKVLSVNVTDGVCYVNFDSGITKATSGVNANITLYAIVNSLTELDSVNKVQIMVDGSQTQSDALGLGFELGNSYERDISMVQKKEGK